MAQPQTVTWHVGTMREGDSRSTLRMNAVVLGSRVEIFKKLIERMDLVMEVTTSEDTLYIKLDIGDQHSKVLPWAEQSTPSNPEALNRAFRDIENEAEQVVHAAHRLLCRQVIQGINPIPIIQHDWTPIPLTVVSTNPLADY